MRLLEWLGVVPKDQRDGIRLQEPECWRVEPTSDGPQFYRALVSLAPADSIVYLEHVVEEPVTPFLRAHAAPNPTPVAIGTVWPTPNRFHVPATAENLRDLAGVLEAQRIVIPAIHTHLYRGRVMLLEWYDAFTDDPIYLSGQFPEQAVRSFAAAIGSAYCWTKHAA